MNMSDKSNKKVACNDDFAYEWIINDGVKFVFVRPAFVDDDGGVPLDQLADDECVFSPGAIYKREKSENPDCCANCGVEITNNYYRGNEVFCSETCANDFNS